MNLNGALAIFVKTPELSAVKTRLAVSLGAARAKRFYELSLIATRAIARDLQKNTANLRVYWAVAELAGLDAKRWASFPTVAQGVGSLGSRLNFVYQNLLKDHAFVCFMGSDSPHVSVEDLNDGILTTAQNKGKKFVVGEALDGGFYFFGGSTPIPRHVWHGVNYSTDQTANQLITRLSEFASIEQIKKNFDIDTAEDLRRYANLSTSSGAFLPEQLDLIRWVHKYR